MWQMNIWIPKKYSIEALLEKVIVHLKTAKSVTEIEEYLLDELCEIRCHISNRAAVERGEIKE
jgi:hypothetical protein